MATQNVETQNFASLSADAQPIRAETIMHTKLNRIASFANPLHRATVETLHCNVFDGKYKPNSADVRGLMRESTAVYHRHPTRASVPKDTCVYNRHLSRAVALMQSFQLCMHIQERGWSFGQ